MSTKPSTIEGTQSTLLSAERRIPGFLGTQAQKPSSKRSRNKTKKLGTAGDEAPVNGDVGVVGNEGISTASGVLPAVGGVDSDDELVAEEKKTSAVEATAKRIRAANKKLQRIEGYESKTEALNQDQQKAIASKPVLQAIVKELAELLDILKAEEADDVAREGRTAKVQEKQHSRAVANALKQAQGEHHKSTLLLLQFLHLRGLFDQSGVPSAFAPTQLPVALEQATGQEVAAVHALFDQFANGPLLGGNGDAVEKLALLEAQSSEEVIPGVPFARVKAMITSMTAIPEPEPETSAQLAPSVVTTVEAAPIAEIRPAARADSTIALIDGATSAKPEHHAPSFINASKIDPPAAQTPPIEEKVASWAEDVESTAPAAAPAAEQAKPAAGAVWGSAPSAAVETKPAPGSDQAWGSAPTTDWSAEDAEGGLPSLDGLAPAIPAAPTADVTTRAAEPAAAAAVIAEGTSFRGRGGHRGGPGRGRGGEFRGGEFRGGRGGRGGSFRGRGGGFHQQQREAPLEDGWERAPSSRPQIGNRGGFGSYKTDGGRGRGRGGPRGAPRTASGAPAGAAPAVAPAAAQ